MEKQAVLDVAAAMKRLAGDIDLFRELAEMFAEDAPPLVKKLEAALAEGNAAAAMRAAHSLKGLAANFGAGPTVMAAQELELVSKRGELDSTPPLLESLKYRLDELQSALREYRSA